MGGTNHYLRVARAIALAGGLASGGCAAIVPDVADAQGGEDAQVTADAVADAPVSPSSCERPGPWGAPCDRPLRCGSGCNQWTCEVPDGGSRGTWTQFLCGGPQPPPELAG